MEQSYQYLIYAHAALGGIALLAGLISIVAKKGQQIHKKSGIVFFFSMLFSAVLALIICFLPGHQNVFLFLIGIFSSYFLLNGYRALRFKKQSPQKFDFFIQFVMLAAALFMLFYPPIFLSKINIVLAIFGVVGLSFSCRDIYVFTKQKEKLKKDWLKKHLGNMMGAYIASVTAFVVVNNLFGGVYNWFVPGVVGTFYIVYWMRKLTPKKKQI